jgi:hypothetical protein
MPAKLLCGSGEVKAPVSTIACATRCRCHAFGQAFAEVEAGHRAQVDAARPSDDPLRLIPAGDFVRGRVGAPRTVGDRSATGVTPPATWKIAVFAPSMSCCAASSAARLCRSQLHWSKHGSRGSASTLGCEELVVGMVDRCPPDPHRLGGHRSVGTRFASSQRPGRRRLACMRQRPHRFVPSFCCAVDRRRIDERLDLRLDPRPGRSSPRGAQRCMQLVHVQLRQHGGDLGRIWERRRRRRRRQIGIDRGSTTGRSGGSDGAARRAVARQAEDRRRVRRGGRGVRRRRIRRSGGRGVRRRRIRRDGHLLHGSGDRCQRCVRRTRRGRPPHVPASSAITVTRASAALNRGDGVWGAVGLSFGAARRHATVHHRSLTA